MFFSFRAKPIQQTYEVIIAKELTCSQGHTYSIAPAFVLTRTPCSSYVFSTDEPDMAYHAYGTTYQQVKQSFADTICHLWHMYSSIGDDIAEEHAVLGAARALFFQRVVRNSEKQEEPQK